MALRAFDNAFEELTGKRCYSTPLWQGWGMNFSFRQTLESLKAGNEFTARQQGAYDNLLEAFPENGSGAKYKN